MGVYGPKLSFGIKLGLRLLFCLLLMVYSRSHCYFRFVGVIDLCGFSGQFSLSKLCLYIHKQLEKMSICFHFNSSFKNLYKKQ